jgi:hypothetical protein
MACVAGPTELASAHGEMKAPHRTAPPSKLCATLDFSRRLRVDRNKGGFSSPKYRFLGLLSRRVFGASVRFSVRSEDLSPLHHEHAMTSS